MNNKVNDQKKNHLKILKDVYSSTVTVCLEPRHKIKDKETITRLKQVHSKRTNKSKDRHRRL